MKFERILKRRHVVAFAFGAIMGWSWVLLTGLWIGEAGTLGAALAFAVAGAAGVVRILNCANVATSFPAGSEIIADMSCESLSWNPAGNRLISATWGRVCVWDTDTKTLIYSVAPTEGNFKTSFAPTKPVVLAST